MVASGDWSPIESRLSSMAPRWAAFEVGRRSLLLLGYLLGAGEIEDEKIAVVLDDEVSIGGGRLELCRLLRRWMRVSSIQIM